MQQEDSVVAKNIRGKQRENSIMVSVIMLSYNAQDTISQALDSVIMQECNFSYEIIIADDCSWDTTLNIAKIYQRKFPQIIKIINQAQNKGTTANAYDAFMIARGKYLASCECDDMWLDPKKLQKQVDFLESNPKYSACSHRVKFVDEKGYPYRYQKISWIKEKKVFRAKDFKGLYLPGHSSSILKRNFFLGDSRDFSIFKTAHKYIGDRTMCMLLLEEGPIFMLDDVMSCYRSSMGEGSNLTNILFGSKKSLKEEYEYTLNLEQYAKEKSRKKYNFLHYKGLLLASSIFAAIKGNADVLSSKIVFRIIKDSKNPVGQLIKLPCSFFQKACQSLTNKKIIKRGVLSDEPTYVPMCNWQLPPQKKSRIMVSICVICDNQARFLKTCLERIFSQKTEHVYEVIMVDNASKDQSKTIIDHFFKKHRKETRLIRMETETDFRELYRVAKANSKGNYFICFPAKDYWRRDSFIQTQIDFLEQNPTYSAVSSITDHTDSYGKEVKRPGIKYENVYTTQKEYSISEFEKDKLPGYVSSLVYRNQIPTETLPLADFSFEKQVALMLIVSGKIKCNLENPCVRRVLPLQEGDASFFSYGNFPYYYVYDEFGRIEKYAKERHGIIINFDKARKNQWIQTCRAFYFSRLPAVAKDVLSILSKAKDRRTYENIVRYRHETLGALNYSTEQLKFDFWREINKQKKKKSINISEQKEIILTSRGNTKYQELPPPQKTPHRDRPMVSIGMTVYNQEKYVGKAIDSILMQEVNFNYEIVIAEDCSTDRSREIVKEYAKKYPDKIKLILQDQNVGVKEQSRQLRVVCRGKYRAHLEGDDYWITKDMLQKRVDFLENNLDYIACAGKICCVNEKDLPCPFPYGRLDSIYSFKQEYTLKDFENWLLPSHTGALLYRNVFFDLPPKERNIYEKYDIVGDRKTAFFLVSQGRIRCLQEVMSVRRIELGSESNFTSVNRRIKPYFAVYSWMNNLEEFAMEIKGININMDASKIQQFKYAIQNYIRVPSKNAREQISLIYKASNKKALYGKILVKTCLQSISKARTQYGLKKFLKKLIDKIVYRITSREKFNLEKVNNIINGKNTIQ